jgi:tetratricopeptide (TPR) repeat protein
VFELKVEQTSNSQSQHYHQVLTEFDRNLVATYYQRGKTNLKLKNYRAALQDFSTILEIDPQKLRTLSRKLLITVKRSPSIPD